MGIGTLRMCRVYVDNNLYAAIYVKIRINVNRYTDNSRQKLFKSLINTINFNESFPLLKFLSHYTT